MQDNNEISFRTGLFVSNSLKDGELEEFLPLKGREVRMYNCGPTVYDKSHMGHARTYVSVDIIRKILSRYFRYDVFYVMNITDIDDKIIKRSNENKEEFNAFARKWEADYFRSMEAIGVSLPDVLVRVSEYVPEIVAFIKKIVDRGYAYESNGSVYFDVQAFRANATHHYPKLDKAAAENLEKLLEGEGVLSEQVQVVPGAPPQTNVSLDKKNLFDFALWKNSKPGEPKWNSPWGEGRPGWHIECSAMASHVFGERFDLHLGGIDLKFPHHNNEVAQSEAYFDSDQWVNYFMHTGHINIEGLKMSKSLKNFITIDELLKHFSARQLRLMFASHKYEALMDYTPIEIDEQTNKVKDYKSMKEAIDRDKRFEEFFRTVRAIQRRFKLTDNQKWFEQEVKLHQALSEVQRQVHKHFLANLNTKEVLNELDKIITETNIYIKQREIKLPLIKKIYDYTIWVFSVMGLEYEAVQKASAQEVAFEELLDSLADLRDIVRDLGAQQRFEEIQAVADKALLSIENGRQNDQAVTANQAEEEKKTGDDEIQQTNTDDFQKLKTIHLSYVRKVRELAISKQKKALFDACDEVRDQQLPYLGVLLEDRQFPPSLWKREDKNLLLQDIQRKRQEKLEAERQKELEKLKKEQEKQEQMRINPREMFLKQTDKFSRFDENGVPTHDNLQKELTAKNLKYYKTQWEKQEKLYNEFLKQQQAK